MIRNILVPTDFSHDAYNALFYVTQLYKHQKCTFHILHAYDKQSHFIAEFKGGRRNKKLQEFLSDRTAESLRETYHKIMADTEKNALHEFVTVPKNNSLEKAVKSYMVENTIDLIAMGTKGRTGALKILFGGNTIQMVKSGLDCPILCIPKQIGFRPISKMGYFSTFKHSVEKFSLTIVKSLAKTYEATLHIAHIDDDLQITSSQGKNKKYLIKYFEDISFLFHNLPLESSKSKTVNNFVKSQELDFLILCYYSHNFLYKLFKEPLAVDLSITSEIPLLILNSPKIKFRK